MLAPAHRHLRRALTKRFPCALYYENFDPRTARVVAVLHTAMDADRLGERTD